MVNAEVQDLQDAALEHGVKLIFRGELASWNADLPENLQAGGSSPLYGFLNGNGSNASRVPAGFQDQWCTYEPPSDSNAHLLDDVQMNDIAALKLLDYREETLL